jgi:hypothetical protein
VDIELCLGKAQALWLREDQEQRCSGCPYLRNSELYSTLTYLSQYRQVEEWEEMEDRKAGSESDFIHTFFNYLFSKHFSSVH